MNIHTAGSELPTTVPTASAPQPRNWAGAFGLAAASVLLATATAGCMAEAQEPTPSPTRGPSTTETPAETPVPPPPEERPEPQPELELTPEPDPEPSVPAPPPELVGHWNGGPGDSSDWYLTIYEDGSWDLVNDWLGLADSGFVDTSGNGFEMYNDTGDASVVDAAGVNGCPWTIKQTAGMTSLWFCEGDLGPLSSWVPAG